MLIFPIFRIWNRNNSIKRIEMKNEYKNTEEYKVTMEPVDSLLVKSLGDYTRDKKL